MTGSSRRSVLKTSFAGAALAALMASAALAQGSAPVAAVKAGAPAPAFTATDANGKSVSLSDYKGKTVVLEWTNAECPFVAKHYGSGNMQALQKKWTDKGVVWLSVISSAPGEQGYVSGADAKKLSTERGATPSDVLLDPKGTLGRLYGAQTTPHMYVIKGDGTLAYMGGIDDKPSTRAADVKTAHNYVDAALTAVAAGQQVAVPTAKAYGCSVKYAPGNT